MSPITPMAKAVPQLFKESELHFVTVIALASDADANRILIHDGVTVAVVNPDEMTNLVDIANDVEHCGRLRLLGVCAVIISKTMLFRSGHHYISSESHTGQIENYASALGVAELVAKCGLNTDKGYPATHRILSHPVYGSPS
eukprot:2198495-Amphidinium_carterae.1